MNPLAIITKFIPDDQVRAKVLVYARHFGQWASGFVVAFVLKFLLAHNVDQDSAVALATAIGAGLSALIVGVTMAVYAILDVNKVAKKIDTAVTVAAATSPNPESAKADALAALKVRS